MMRPLRWWAKSAPLGWDRVKVSENVGATAVAPVAPVVTSLPYIDYKSLVDQSKSLKKWNKQLPPISVQIIFTSLKIRMLKTIKQIIGKISQSMLFK